MSVAPGAARPRPEDRPVRVVSAKKSLRQRIVDIWNAREILTYLVSTDIKIKYKASALGLVWSMIAPTMTIMVYFVVFQVIMKNGIPDYVIMLWAGMLCWNFFTNVVQESTSVIVKQSGIVKKVAFPREVLALSTVGTSAVYFGMQLLVLAGLMGVLQRAPDWGMIWLLPIAFLALTVLAAALGVFLSAINVYFRDTEHLVSVGITLWFWLTPIVYSFESKVSPMLHRHHVLWLYFLNPVTPIVMTFQRVLYRTISVISTTPDHSRLTVLPTWSTWRYAELDLGLLLLGLVALLVATKVFGRLEGNFAEEL